MKCQDSLVVGHDYGQKESEPVVCWEDEGVLCPSIGKAPTSLLHPTHAQAASQPHSKTRTCWGHTHSQTGWQKRPHSRSCWYILSRPQVQGSHAPLLKAILSFVTAWSSDVPRPALQRGSGQFGAHIEVDSNWKLEQRLQVTVVGRHSSSMKRSYTLSLGIWLDGVGGRLT